MLFCGIFLIMYFMKGYNMVTSINNIEQSIFQPEVYQRGLFSTEEKSEPKSLFTDEDEAIISSQAKLYNELEKFNSGQGDPLDLMVAGVLAKVTVEAEVNVINIKKILWILFCRLGSRAMVFKFCLNSFNYIISFNTDLIQGKA